MGKRDFPGAGREAPRIASGVGFVMLTVERFGVEDGLPVIRAKARAYSCAHGLCFVVTLELVADAIYSRRTAHIFVCV